MACNGCRILSIVDTQHFHLKEKDEVSFSLYFIVFINWEKSNNYANQQINTDKLSTELKQGQSNVISKEDMYSSNTQGKV